MKIAIIVFLLFSIKSFSAVSGIKMEGTVRSFTESRVKICAGARVWVIKKQYFSGQVSVGKKASAMVPSLKLIKPTARSC